MKELMFCTAGIVAMVVQADTFTWTGGGANKNWSTAANWSPAQAMTAADTANFQAGTLASDTVTYDSGAFKDITVQSGAWTANVSSATFTDKPITIASGAAFALSGASARVNPFSTNNNANAVAGLLDLGGASQTIADSMAGNNAGFFHNGGEIRNGTLVIDGSVSAALANTTFTVGSGADVSGAVRFYVNGAHLVVDGGSLRATSTATSNHPIGSSNPSSVTVRNGGTFSVASDVWVGFTAHGQLIGDGGTFDLGSKLLIMSVRNNVQSVLALTNATLSCGNIQFGYSSSWTSVGRQTVILKDSVARLSKFTGSTANLNSNSSLLFDGATLVPKAATADFLPASNKIPTPTLGAGGLVVSNNYDVTIAKGLSGAGCLVKAGDATLTLSGTHAFTGGIDVREGTLALTPGAVFANQTLAMADGTTLKLKYSPDHGFPTANLALALDANTDGSVTVDIDLSAGFPEAGRAYTLFASGLDAATLKRLKFIPESSFDLALTSGGALTITLPNTPGTHVWTGGGADAKWTTAANWDVDKDFGPLDRVVFGGTGSSSVFDCADGLRLWDITVNSGCHTANVETASFANSPVVVARGAEFTLEGADGVVNPFSTLQSTNAIAGVLDLGGASQTISTSLTGDGAGTFLDGGEIRNGTVELVSGHWIYLKNTAFTVGPGADITSDLRFYLQDGAHLKIDGGSFTTTDTGAGTDYNVHTVGTYGEPSTLEVSHGGRLTAPFMFWIVGHNAAGAIFGDGGIIDIGDKPIYLSNNNGGPATLALTNATLTCSSIDFGYAASRGAAQTMVLKDTLVNLSRFVFRHKTDESTILFDGATLVPKAASASFLPAGLPTPTLGAGGLTVSNAFDVTAAAGLAGAGGLVKKGTGELALSGPNTFTGGIDVQEGTLALAPGASFPDATPFALADGTALRVKFSPDGFASTNIALVLDANTDGKVTLEIDASGAVPEFNRPYTLFNSGIDAATLSRLTIAPAHATAVSEDGALTVTFTPAPHTWTGGGADAKWTTGANWSTGEPVATFDPVVFSLGGRSVYDCMDGMRLWSITAGYGCHTVDVATASFAETPVTVASGATFALENADRVTNPFSTAANTNAISGILDLGGAVQTFSTLLTGNGAGAFRDGGEIRNGSVTLVSDSWQSFENTSFTIGPDAHVASSARFYLQHGAHLTIDGGTYTNSHANNHVIGGGGNMSTLEVSNGGRLFAPLEWFVGHNTGGALIGDGGVIDVGNKPLYLSNNNNAPSVLALTNAVLTCSDINFAYGTSKGATQTVVFKDTVVNFAKFVFNRNTDASSILFDGATLVPKAAAANFMPAGLPKPTLGAGGLVISNAFDVTAAVGMTGEGGLVKKGSGTLTLTGAQTFAGDVVVSNGAFAASSTFAGGLRAASGTVIDVADATFHGDIVIEEGVATAATNGVDWAETRAVPVAKTTAGISHPRRSDANGRYYFAQAKDGLQILCYGKPAGTIMIFK
ncbi:MAG: autotransporter-associated beta strand repeat-containing protein [Kiritimatiellae bacterium]|nr:autotransporter-associated beta strand repeat-containing protein [Kiritimatiellia bacterium]